MGGIQGVPGTKNDPNACFDTHHPDKMLINSNLKYRPIFKVYKNKMMEDRLLEAVQALEQRTALLVGSLSVAGCEELKMLSQNPLFCEEAPVRRLVEYLVDRRAQRPKNGFLPQILYWEVYHRKTLDIKRLATLFTGAISLIEDYISWKSLKEDRMKQREYVTRYAAALPETTVFRYALSEWERAVAEAPESYEKLYQKCRLLQEEWSYWATDRYKKAPKLIQDILFAHEAYCQTVKRMCDLGGEMRAALLNDPEGATPENTKHTNLLLTLTEKLIALRLNTGDEGAFVSFRKEYERCFLELGQSERESLFRAMINHCTRQMKEGHTGFVQQLFDLCSWALRQKSFTARWLRSDEDFLNIAMAFCRPDALPEMKDFIQQHAKNLPAHTRDDARALALAYYHFFKGEWRISLDHLNTVTNREITYKLRFHSLRIRIHYEIGKPDQDFEALEKALEAYDKYFDRDEWLHDRRRDHYVRLAWFVRKMMTFSRSHKPGSRADTYHFMLNALEDAAAAKPIALEWVMNEVEKWRPGS